MSSVLVALVLLAQGPSYVEDRFEIPKGFRVYKAAERELCGGSYDIVFDGQGRLLVGDGTQVRRLEDRNQDGVFDHAEVIAQGLGPRGPQGLLVVGDRLYAVGGDGLQLFTGYPGPLKHAGRLGAPFSTGGDHAAHQVVRGHDDYLYFIVGDGAGAKDRVHITEESSPARAERACTVFRISPDGKKWEGVGTGGRNAPNLGMNALGDLFSLDSDMEWHVDLPWWRPVRLHHWVTGGDQGWQSVGAYPPYYIDTLPGVCDVGRGSPDWGVFYEHVQFPARYRDAYFVCDYRSKSATTGGYATSGRLFVFFLARSGGSYEAKHEVFAIPKPGSKIDFALVDVEVGPDGSLYVSDHGQGVWRIVYDPEGRGAPPIVPRDVPATAQPQSEWSRLRRGTPAASLDGPDRLAALRLLASRFEEIPHETLAKLAKDASPDVRGYAAWLLGIQRKKEGATLLVEMTKDADAFVRRKALEALTRNRPASAELGPVVRCLDDADRVVRYAAMTALSHHAREAWFDLAAKGGAQARLRALVAAPPPADRAKAMVRELSREVSKTEDVLDLLRVLGRLRPSLEGDPEVAAYLLAGGLGSDARVRWEKARLIGEYRLAAGVPVLLEALVSEKDRVTQFHLAQALARLPEGWTEESERRALGWFLEAQRGWFAEFPGKGLEFPAFWSTVLAQFAEHHKGALLGALDRVDLKGLLGAAALQALAAGEGAAERLGRLYAAREEGDVRLRILGAFQRVRTAEAREFLVRELRVLKDERLRGAALSALAAVPVGEDARFFLEEGLRHEDREVVRACALGLARYKGGARRETGQLLITRLEQQRELFVACERALVAISGKRREGWRENADPRRGPEDPERREGLAFWKAWYRDQFGQEFRPTEAKAPEWSNEELRKFVLSEGARGGRAERGRVVYAGLCVRCHGGTDDAGAAGAVLFGPDLTGVTRRLTREEIADAIVYPSKVVAERFRATAVQLESGDVLSGFVTEQDEKTLTLVDASRVHRLERSKVRAVKAQETSLMPDYLLNRLPADQVRDLLAFLEEVGSKPEKK
jgi:putative heme-binding domain-containing protein